MKVKALPTGPSLPDLSTSPTARREKNDVADSSVRLCKSKSSFFLMARPFCCAKASDTTSLRPVAPHLEAVSLGLTKGRPPHFPTPAIKNPPSFIPWQCCNSLRPSAAYRADPPPLNSAAQKHFLYSSAAYRGNKSITLPAARRAKPFIAAH